MKNSLKKILHVTGGKDLLIILVLSCAGYILIERLGLFRLSPASYRQIFHSAPSRLLSIFLFIHAIVRLFLAWKEGRPRKRAGATLFSVSIMILATGLWFSVYTRFEGEIIRSPGQVFSGFKDDYLQQSLYLSKYAAAPEIGMYLGQLHLSPSSDLKTMRKIVAEISYSGKWTKRVEGGTLSSAWPLFSDWALLRITDFGYAPKYVLHDLNEKELESHYVHMKLFPAGTEDYFRTRFLGYVFYLRCYPDYVDNKGVPETRSAYTENPVCNIRIVRNKDIVYSGLLPPDKKLKFDNYVITLPEMKMWVKIRFVRDFGLIIAGPGLLLLLISTIIMSKKNHT
jgi:hypothetical protein